MPVDGRAFAQIVLHADDDVFAFLEVQDGRSLATIVADPVLLEGSGVDPDLVDGDVIGASLRGQSEGKPQHYGERPQEVRVFHVFSVSADQKHGLAKRRSLPSSEGREKDQLGQRFETEEDRK
jgi:hypothetical protein